MASFKKKKKASSAAGLPYSFLAEEGEVALILQWETRLAVGTPQKFGCGLRPNQSFFWSGKFSRDGEEKRTRELSSSWKVGGVPQGGDPESRKSERAG